jgi:hypothetical protein
VALRCGPAIGCWAKAGPLNSNVTARVDNNWRWIGMTASFRADQKDLHRKRQLAG